METKFVEIRDHGTCIPVMCTLLRVNMYEDRVGAQFVHGRASHPTGEFPSVLMTDLNKGRSEFDYYNWQSRSLQVPHKWIQENWSSIVSGQVVDCRVISGELDRPPAREICRFPLPGELAASEPAAEPLEGAAPAA